ncbi:hypothetical protein D3C85_1428850 [compost metagenome]
MQRRHTQQVAGQRRIGTPVFTIEPDPAQVVERRNIPVQGLIAQIVVQRLQVRGLFQTADQDEAFAQGRTLAGHPHTVVQPLPLTTTARCRNDALR